jgi:hypothetical protein
MTIAPETRAPETSDRERLDDYRIQPDPGQLTRPVTHHVLDTARVLMLIVLAVLSFALFWVAATLLGIV